MNVEEYARMYEAEERQWWYVGMRAISFALLEDLALPSAGRTRRILDTGCGTGSNLTYLSRYGRAVGVDLAGEAIAFCRARGETVVRGSVSSLPFRDSSVDGVTSFDVIYHARVTDDRAAMREMARVLRPDGFLLLRVPALKALWGAHDEAVHSRHRYTRLEVERLFGDAGLTLLRSTYANTILLPLLFVRRTLDRLTGRHGSDVGLLPAPLEWLFRHALQCESVLVRRGLSLPIGASLFALGVKKSSSGTSGPGG